MEKSDEKFLDKFFKHPALIVIVIGLLTVFFAFQLPRAQLDNNNYRFVPDADEARKVSNYIDDTFGSSSFVLVGLERKYGTVFDGEFINLIREYVTRIEDIEIVGDINSIVSSDYIAGVGDSIVVEKLVPDDFSGTREEIAELKNKVLSWDMYRRSLISDDFTATQVLVPLEIASDDAGRPEVIDSFIRIRDIAREMFDGHADVYVTGLPVISATINEAVRADLVLMVPLVILVVLLILFFSFRRLTPVVLPLLTVLVAVIWSMGAMPLFDIKLSVISTVLPVILVAVGSAYGIHVVTHYIEDMGVKARLNKDEHRELVVALLRKIGKAVSLAALTTFVGFASFCFTSVLPIREFGYFSSFGVFASFIVAVTMIPALLLIRGPRPLRNKAAGKNQADAVSSSRSSPPDILSGLMADVFMAIARKRRFVIFITVVVTLISLYGVSKVIIDNIFVEYFRSTTDISRSDLFIREKFGGSKVVSIVAAADSPEILLGPESLGAMDSLNAHLEKRVPEVGKVMGFTDLIKRVNQVFNVDESPDGIKAVSSGGGGGFGDFGFGGEADFGFGFAGDEAAAEGNFDDFTSPPVKADLSVEELLAALEKAANSGSNHSISGDELIRELEKLLNYRGISYYEIPTDPERYGKTSNEELQRLVANYLVLLSGNISSYANDPLEPTAIKTTVQLRTLGEADTGRALGEIDRFVKDKFPENIKVTVGGSALVEASLNRLVVQSQLSSVVISLLLVFLIIAVSNRSVAAGIIGIAPLTISILINFAVMGFLGIKLNIGTSMVASVSVGIGIDYTIHYIEAYKREYRASGGAGDFLRRTFTTSGKAILINAISVGAGFAVLIFSQFNMLKDLGLLIALTMGTSALVSLTVIPVLLLYFKPKFVQGENL